MIAKPLMVRPVVTLGFRRQYWLQTDCKWCRLFQLGNGCIACAELYRQIALVVQMDEFRRRRYEASCRPYRLSILLEWLRDRGLHVELR